MAQLQHAFGWWHLFNHLFCSFLYHSAWIGSVSLQFSHTVLTILNTDTCSLDWFFRIWSYWFWVSQLLSCNRSLMIRDFLTLCCDFCYSFVPSVLWFMICWYWSPNICLRSLVPSAISISSVPGTNISVLEDSNIEFDFYVAALSFYKPLHTKMGSTWVSLISVKACHMDAHLWTHPHGHHVFIKAEC